MARRRRRLELVALVVVIVAAFAAAFGAFAGSDTRDIQASIERLVAAVRFDDRHESAIEHRARLERALDALVAPAVVVRIPDLPGAEGRTQLLEIAADGALRRIELDLSDLSVAVDGDRATARARATLSAVTREHELRERRNVTLAFIRNGGTFRVSSLEVAPRPNDQPEARP